MNKKVLVIVMSVFLFGKQALCEHSALTENSKPSLPQEQVAVKKKQQQISVVNCFRLPVIIGLYNTKLGQVERVMEHILHQQKTVIPQNFFIRRVEEVVGSEGKYVFIGYSYGVEKRTPKNSYFIPEFKGILLEIDDLTALAHMSEKASTLLISMIMVGDYPIAFISNPETGEVLAIPCGELKPALVQDGSVVRSLIESNETLSLLFSSGYSRALA